eukprot:TRINITY_DN19554_c0_g1_i4.p1 TRINITY_DN19554_c0_g1~~TRINITY_DN19554_c0_g1_i4.p1  ORF type:complete len:701 (+),score=121.60 TRINITY_DN19554_c0_g1_i4:63-2105(+)
MYNQDLGSLRSQAQRILNQEAVAVQDAFNRGRETVRHAMADAGSDGETSSLIPIVSPTLHFLADKLEYEEPSAHARKVVPWGTVVNGAIVFLLALVAFLLDLKLLRMVDGLALFVSGSGKLSANIMDATSHWMTVETNGVIENLGVVSSLGTEFATRVQTFVTQLPDVTAYESEMAQGVQPGSLAYKELVQLNSSLCEIKGYTGKVADSLLQISNQTQQNVIEFQKAYNRQIEEWGKIVRTQGLVQSKALMTSVLGDTRAAEKTFHHNLEMLNAFMGSLRRSTGEPLPFNFRCLNDIDGGLKNVNTLTDNQQKQYIDNFTDIVQHSANISRYVSVVLVQLNVRTREFVELDNNVSAAITDIQMLSGAQVNSQAREAAAKRLAAATAQARTIMVRMSTLEAEPLTAVLWRVNNSCQDVLQYSAKIHAEAKEVEAQVTSLNEMYTYHIFNQGNVVPAIRVSIFAMLAAAGCIGVAFYLGSYGQDLDELVHEDDEAMKGLCAFHTLVHELDVTSKDIILRPFKRQWLRTKFIFQHAKKLAFVWWTSELLMLVLIVHAGVTMIPGLKMWLVAAVLGDACDELPMLSSEVVCAASVADVRNLFADAEILPGGSCSSAGLLVCAEFLKPFVVYQLIELVLKFLALLAMVVLALEAPQAMRHAFADIVDEIVQKSVLDNGEIGRAHV